MNDEIEKVSELVLCFILRNFLTKISKIISDELLLPDTFSCVTYYCPGYHLSYKCPLYCI